MEENHSKFSQVNPITFIEHIYYTATYPPPN